MDSFIFLWNMVSLYSLSFSLSQKMRGFSLGPKRFRYENAKRRANSREQSKTTTWCSNGGDIIKVNKSYHQSNLIPEKGTVPFPDQPERLKEIREFDTNILKVTHPYGPFPKFPKQIISQKDKGRFNWEIYAQRTTTKVIVWENVWFREKWRIVAIVCRNQSWDVT